MTTDNASHEIALFESEGYASTKLKTIWSNAPSDTGPARRVHSIAVKLFDGQSLQLVSTLQTFRTAPAENLEALRKQRRAVASRFGDLADYGCMHEVFQHEGVTEPWIKKLEILDADTSEPLDLDTVKLSEAQSREANGFLTACVGQ